MVRSLALLWLTCFLITACNLPLVSPEVVEPTIQPAATQAAIQPSATPRMLPSNTPVPSATPSPTPTTDTTPASMRSLTGDLICRFGPGLRYGVGGSLRGSEQVLITARNGAGDWFQFELVGYPGKFCWVPAKDVEARGDLTELDIAEAPPSYVTNVSVLFDPPVIEPAVCIFPLTFTVTFTIETIGPAFVTFQRSTSKGLAAPPETVEFTESGPRVYEDYLQVNSAGEHWFRVAVTSPNSIVGQGIGTVVCP